MSSKASSFDFPALLGTHIVALHHVASLRSSSAPALPSASSATTGVPAQAQAQVQGLRDIVDDYLARLAVTGREHIAIDAFVAEMVALLEGLMPGAKVSVMVGALWGAGIASVHE